MNKAEHLLTVLSEECSEVAQQASKAARFGMEDHDPRDPEKVTNRRRLEIELAEVMAIADMLGLRIREEDKQAKYKKVVKYMGVSMKLGTLDPGTEGPGCKTHEGDPHPTCVPCMEAAK